MESMLPADTHVHSQWSWDATSGSMEETCRQAVALGVPGVAFTEHVDLTPWTIPAAGVATMPDEYRAMVGPDDLFRAPPFDVAGYAEALERCRTRFPELRIRSGVELGEPHWHPEQVAGLLAEYNFDRVIASVHSLAERDEYFVIHRCFATHDPDGVVGGYLNEVLRMVDSALPFAVLGHLDYPLRDWPAAAGPVAPQRFQEHFRAVLHALAASGRALEINTRGPAVRDLLEWWRDCGGRDITFGSDAHDPGGVAHDFAAAAQCANAAGFHPAGDDFWTRVSVL